MHWLRASAGLMSATLLAAPSAAQVIPLEQRTFNEQVLRPTGQPVVPLFDGWYENPDGTFGICFGYFNLNIDEAVDIPLGPDNFIEPSEFDGMQPTHFDKVPEANYRRHFCVFSVEGPENCGDQRVVWTLRSRGEELSTPGKLLGPYVLDEPETGGRGVVAPVLRFGTDQPEFKGRNGFTAEPRSVSVGSPLALTVDVDHPAARSWVGWTKHQGPGEVDFAQAEIRVDREEGVATTTATFSEPGQYLLRVQAIYSTTSFEYHCCWTNGYIPVTVTR